MTQRTLFPVKTIKILFTAPLILIPGIAVSYDDLIISEYVEGSSNNKALEIYNGTDTAIDLSSYAIDIYFNGNPEAGLSLALSGVLDPSQTYILAHAAAAPGLIANADATTASGLFNGDDAIVLSYAGSIIDSIGQIGFDPGIQWGTGTLGTQNQTLRRLPTITTGDSNALDAFDPSLEWQAFPQDSFDDIGQYAGESINDNDNDNPTAIGACGDFATHIHLIQGDTENSPLVDSTVVVEGVVTGTRNNGFFIQEEPTDEDGDPSTSEGIFVYSSELVSIGDTLRVAGTVTEYFGLTELTAVTALAECGPGVAITPLALDLNVIDGSTDLSLEAVEAMLVSISGATVSDINNLWRYGEIGVDSTVRRTATDVFAPGTADFNTLVASNAIPPLIIEDDNATRFPDELSLYPQFSYDASIRVGDTISVRGPLNYSFGEYRISAIEPAQVTSSRESNPSLRPGNLTVATFNVLNYFNGLITADGSVTFDYPENRGAKSQEEFELQQARIVAAISAMDADIVGLMEIENDGFGPNSAIASLTDAINAELPPYKHYRFVEPAQGAQVGSDAIAVGMLYRPRVVKLKGDSALIAMPEQALPDGSLVQMRTSLLQTFKHRQSKERLTIVVNHFKSKGSECLEDLTQQDTVTVSQGSCNALRVSAAVTLATALESKKLPRKIMILGDLNAYSAEDPIAVLTGYDAVDRGYEIVTAVNTNMDNGQSAVAPTFDFTNLVPHFDATGYSYWYYMTGEVGSLDHVLVSPALESSVVDVSHWNINAPEPYQLQYDQALQYYPDAEGYNFTGVGPYRSSDHDPVLVSINLKKKRKN